MWGVHYCQSPENLVQLNGGNKVGLPLWNAAFYTVTNEQDVTDELIERGRERLS